jgi:hypothetical protein
MPSLWKTLLLRIGTLSNFVPAQNLVIKIADWFGNSLRDDKLTHTPHTDRRVELCEAFKNGQIRYERAHLNSKSLHRTLLPRGIWKCFVLLDPFRRPGQFARILWEVGGYQEKRRAL